MRLYIVSVLCLALAACGAPESKTYTAPAAEGGRLCVNQCRLSADYCREGCDDTYRVCVGNVQAQALRDYDQYAREQYAAGQPIDLYLHDFERVTPCDDAHDSCTNRCENDYGMCYGNCGGKVDVAPACKFLCF